MSGQDMARRSGSSSGPAVVVSTLLMVLLAAPGPWHAVVGLAVVAAAGWAVHRHREVLAWERDLDLAFGRAEQRRLQARRTL